MEKNKPFVSVHKIAQFFQKVAGELDKNQVGELKEELKKLYPTDTSEVLFSAGYSEEENSIGISIYVSNPAAKTEATISFDQLMYEYLTHANLMKLPQVFDCINLLEQKGGKRYAVDFIPVFYTKAIDKHDIHFRISRS